jgi:hypothetical protein
MMILRYWSDYYKDDFEYYNIIDKRYTLNRPCITDNNYYIKNSMFYDLYDRAIDCTLLNSKKLLVELSIFLNCSTTNNRGVVYIVSGNFIMASCLSRSSAIFNTDSTICWGLFVHSKSETQCMNYLLQTSVSNSYNINY